MKTILIIGTIILIIIIGLLLFPKKSDNGKITTNMTISSSAFSNNAAIPSKYACDGEDINPPLSISDVPENSKSLALIIDDPDSPSGAFTHWTVWNIDTSIKEISENSVPKSGVEGMTDFGKIGYGGPCPGTGKHRYFFKIYALDINLKLAKGAAKKDIENAMTGHVSAQAELVGLYQRIK